MEKNNQCRLIVSTYDNITDCYVSHLYKSKGLSISQAIDADVCEVIGKNFSNINNIKCEEIKQNVIDNKTVVLYLDINLELVCKEKVISQTSSYEAPLVPFVCVGWSDYGFCKSTSKSGIATKNRGYLILCPIDKLQEEENFFYLPYKYIKYHEDPQSNIIKESWAFSNIEKTVIPRRARIEMKIGEKVYSDFDGSYETDAPPVYAYANGNPLVPLRSVATRLGYTVTWNKRTKRATLTKGDVVIEVKAGQNSCIKNNEKVYLSVKPVISKDSRRMYVSLGFVKVVLEHSAEFIKHGELIRIYRNR